MTCKRVLISLDLLDRYITQVYMYACYMDMNIYTCALMHTHIRAHTHICIYD